MYLVIDTETTGLDPKRNSILEIGIVAVTDDFEPIAHYESTVLPCGEIQPAAMKCNQIDIREITKPYNQVVEEVIIFITETCHGEKPGLIGHNIMFDLPFIDQLYRSHSTMRFANTYDYRRVHDVKAVANFLVSLGIIQCKTSLDVLVMLLSEDAPARKRPGHRALNDCFRTLSVFMELRRRLSNLLK